MKYRAKITAIQYWVMNVYNVVKNPIVKDENDIYIEVSSAEEADDLETLNNIRTSERLQKRYIMETYVNKK